MNNVWVYPYKAGSNSARDLARELGVRRISHTNSRFRGREDRTIINWGASRLPEEVGKCTILNKPECVSRASNKLSFFQTVTETDVRIPDWTTDVNRAVEWAIEDGHTVVGRQVLNGHSGEGIVLFSAEDIHRIEVPLRDIPLFVKYVKKRNEYRVHVFQGQVVDVQRKARDRDVADADVNWQVRNHANGFVFAREGEALGDVPQDVLDQSVAAVRACELDFGAVDVVYNDASSSAYVIEINTSPGLTGTTLDNYAQQFRNYFDGR